MKTTLQMQSWLLSLAACLIAAPAWAGTITVGQSGADYVTIQEAVDAASNGDTISVAAGTYTENVTLGKQLIVKGAGSGTGGTLLVAAAGDSKLGVVNLTASGLSDTEALTLQDLRISAIGRAGISVGRFTEATAVSVSYVQLDNVKVIGSNTSPATEQERGLYVDNTSSLQHLTVKNCSFDNLTYGWYIQKQVSADASALRYVTVENSTFSHNNAKGFYVEKLSDATFTGCTFDGNGFDGSVLPSYFAPWMCGVDINLKAGTYSMLVFDGCSITNNGAGGAKEGVGIAVKARDDGATYGAFPATVAGVMIRACTITGNERGVRLGEPGKNNAGPTQVTIESCTFSDNTQHYVGTDGTAYGNVVNQSLAVVTASSNYWGSVAGPGASVVGNVASLPYYTDAALTHLFYPVRNITRDTGSTTIQLAVDSAQAGDVVEISDGTYALSGTLNITKALSLVGSSAAGVIIDASANGTGYGISIEADNVTLQNFTLLPPITATRGTSSGGGFPIHASYNHTPPVGPYANLTLANLTITNGNRSAFDIHGYNGVTLTNLTASNSAYGNGIQLTGCTNASITHCATTGNAWGGVAFYASKSAYLNRPSSATTFDLAANLIGETVYVEDEFGLVNSVTVTNSTYQIDNNYNPGTAFMHMYTAGDLAKATMIGQGLDVKYSNTAATIRNSSSGNFNVAPPMRIQAAIDAAAAGDTIQVYPGVYTDGQYVRVNKQGLKIVGVDQNGTPIDAATRVLATVGPLAGGEADMVFHVVANDVTISGIRIADQNNKAMTINGDNFTLTNCRFENEWDLSGAIYFYDATPGVKSDVNKSAQKSFTITGNVIKGWGVAITDGTGCGWPAANRVIKNNTFALSLLYPGGTFYSIGFRSVNGSGWCNSPVGGATITGNTFEDLGTRGYVYFDGTVPAEGLDFKAILKNNMFPMGAVMAFDPTGAPRTALPGDPLFNATSRPNLVVLKNVIGAEITKSQAGDTVLVGPGTYAENLVVDKRLDIRGPNYGVAGNAARGAEAVIMPATSAIASGELIHVAASDVTLDGLTLDGDNPALNSGFAGTNGADLDASEAVTVYADSVNNLNVAHNVIRNFSYFGVTLYGGATSAATSGHMVSDNLIKDLGTYDAASGISKWGGGVLIYNNQYAKVTDNVMENVRIGIQTGNFSQANPGSMDSQGIDGNAIQARRTGIFHNLHYGPASPYTLSNNTLTGLANENEVSVRGILLSSLSVPSLSSGNAISMSGVTAASSGYEVWNVQASSPTAITGGSVTGAAIGLFLNNFEGYTSNATDGAHASVSGLSITPPVGGTGIRVLDSASSTHANVQLAIGTGVSVVGGSKGLVVENTNAAVTTPGNLSLSGQSGNYIELLNNAVNIDATSVQFAGKIGSAMHVADLLDVESKVLHNYDNPALGLVTWKAGLDPADVIVSDEQEVGDFQIPSGTTVTVSSTGSLGVTGLDLAEGASLVVEGGSLDLGQGSEISGSFTIFNSFGSWNIDGDTTFNIGHNLALISDIHVAAGKTVTVNGGGELVLDGCVVNSQTPGTPYNITAATDGLLTIARCVVTDANIDINTTLPGNLKSRVFDSSFTTSDIEAGAAAKVYHNLFDTATNAAANSDSPATGAFDAIDGWANVTDPKKLQNKFTLDFEAPGVALVGRTLDAAGNLFVQPADAVVMKMDVAALGANTITAAEALLGYNSAMLALTDTPTRVTPLESWEVIAETATVPGSFGLVDSALGLKLTNPITNPDGISADAQIAKVNFSAGAPGLTVGFFRVQNDGNFNPDGSLVKDTRLTRSTAGMPSLLTTFTANTGELVIDNEAPAIAVSSVNGLQTQANSVSPVDVLDPTLPGPVSPNYVFRNGSPLVLTFTATDAGLAGLDAPDATADLALTASNGTTSLAYGVSAAEVAGVVTYTVTLAVPSNATTGSYAVSATVRDRSGNVSPLTELGSFRIANEVLAAVELQGYAGGTREVVFTATDAAGTALTSWTKNVVFTGSVGTVPLQAVPAYTAAISAKTAWNLRRKLPVAFSSEGVGAVSLTGAKQLPGGDLTGDNVVNTLDYSLLRYHWMSADAVADITGDAAVGTGDYNLLKANFYTIGDAQ